MTSKEERYRDLLGRMPGSDRKVKMEAELKELRESFLATHSNAERQESFVKKHEQELAVLKKKDPNKDEKPANTKYLSREAIIESNKERTALAWLAVEHLADEIEKLEGRIKELAEAGLPKVGKA